MKQNRTNRLWIIAEGALCLLPLGLLLAAPTLDLGHKEVIWVLASCVFGCLISGLALWLSRKQLEKAGTGIFLQMLWLVPAMQYAFLFILLIAMRRPEVIPGSLMNIMLGLLFIVMGNILPKSEPNPVFGVRTTWTLSNRENWVVTARLTGRTWVIGGLLCWLLVLFPMNFTLDIVLILVIALCPFVISWMVYRRQVRDGSWKVDMDLKETAALSRPVKILLWVIGILAIVFCTLLLVFGGQYSITTEQDHLQLHSSLVSDEDIPLKETQSLILKEDRDPGRRNFGYAAFDTRLGRYENSEYGQYIRFTSGSGPVIELKEDGKTYVFNYSEPEKTTALFEQLKQILSELGSDAQIRQETGSSS